MKIKLFNRDGADLWLERVREIEPNISEWKLMVDKKHDYCLKYLRVIGNYPTEIDAVDPSGGPFISVGNEYENKYKIVKIIGPTIFWISERNNNR